MNVAVVQGLEKEVLVVLRQYNKTILDEAGTKTWRLSQAKIPCCERGVDDDRDSSYVFQNPGTSLKEDRDSPKFSYTKNTHQMIFDR